MILILIQTKNTKRIMGDPVTTGSAFEHAAMKRAFAHLWAFCVEAEPMRAGGIPLAVLIKTVFKIW